MTQPPSRDVLLKVRRLAQLAADLRQGKDFPSTRLTVLKSLCQEPEVAARFALHLARRIREKVEEQAKKPGYLQTKEWARHRELIDRGVGAMEQHVATPSEERSSKLWGLLREMEGEQNEHRHIHGGPVRMIKNNDLLLVEYALRCFLADEASVPMWAYQTARHHAERYDPHRGTGLIPASASLVQDVVDFWATYFDVDLAAAPSAERGNEAPSPARAGAERGSRAKKGKGGPAFTDRQGQFLAFIHLYRKLHRRGPAELDLVRYFRVTPPSVHGTIVKLEQLGLIVKEAGVARSARVAIPEEDVPELEAVEGPPW